MTDRICTVADCEKPRKRRGRMCSMHSARVYRHGDVNARRTAAPRRLTSNGYVSVFDPAHPLADGHGRVYEHRKILLDAIGPGAHACHWCQRLVWWTATPLLTVDHLDWNRLNNTPANLVPSCDGCNLGRPAVIRRGELAAMAKLTADDVLQIRASCLSHRELAEAYPVSASQICHIRRGEQWKHLLAADARQ